MGDYTRRDILIILFMALIVSLMIALIFAGFYTVAKDQRLEDSSKRKHCLQIGGTVVPSSDGWACALGAARPER